MRSADCLEAIATIYPSFRLHCIFTSHLYPLRGNKTKLTALMAKILFRIGNRIPTCFPSLIYRQIISCKQFGGQGAYPFTSLVTRIATSHFNLSIPPCELRTLGPFTSSNVRKMNLVSKLIIGVSGLLGRTLSGHSQRRHCCRA